MLYDWGVHLLDQILYMMPETKRVLALMDTVRQSAHTGKSVDFE